MVKLKTSVFTGILLVTVLLFSTIVFKTGTLSKYRQPTKDFKITSVKTLDTHAKDVYTIKPNGFVKALDTINKDINTPRPDGVVERLWLNASLDSTTRDLMRMIDAILAKDTGWEKAAPRDPGRVECKANRLMFNGVEDLLCMTPPNFSPNYTNPCWVDDAGTFRCLPYFQVIGMDKCGSTDLFDRIAKHPDVLMNKGALHKETQWWSWKRYGHWLHSADRRKSRFQDYLNYFSNASTTIQANSSRHYITGDGTPMDLWHMSGWVDIPQNQGLQEPKYITPHLIRHVNPDVKLIAIFRDPVERVFSDYFFLGGGVMTTSGFHNAVVRSLKLLYNCTRILTLRACVYGQTAHRQIKARIHLGFYWLFLRDWFQVFPRKQFLILRTEDFASDIKGRIVETFRFLNLRALPEQTMDTIAVAHRKHVTKMKQRVGSMQLKTRLLLEYLYDAPNQHFSELLNDPAYLW